MVLMTMSCKKFLDEKPTNSLAQPQTLSDLQALLDDSQSMNQLRTSAMAEGAADDAFLPPTTYSTFGDFEKSVYTWNYIGTYFSNDWSAGYLPVFNANYCLDVVSTIPVTPANQADVNNVIGSAHFYRAYNFLSLACTFTKAYDAATAATDLGLPLRVQSDFNKQSVRSNVQQTYDQVISDAQAAIPLLPALPPHPMRPSKAAAYGLLSRVYLYMRKYDEAYKYADSALKIKSDLMNYNGDTEVGNLTGTALPFKQFNKETIFYTEHSLNTGLVNPGSARIDTVLYASYAANDQRKKGFFTPADGYQRFKGSYASGTRLFTGIATDELYLIRAECSARKNDKTGALADLNTLLAKRYVTGTAAVTATDANDALQKILVERRKELLMRGNRWIDLKRFNKEGANITLTRKAEGKTYTLSPNSQKYALLIPLDVINISGMPQNPQQ